MGFLIEISKDKELLVTVRSNVRKWKGDGFANNSILLETLLVVKGGQETLSSSLVLGKAIQ